MPPRSEGLLEKRGWEYDDDDAVAAAIAALRRSSQYIRPYFLKKTTGRNTKLRRTAYLDGLRGVAALIVYFGHHELWAHDAVHPEIILENGFGYKGQYYFAALPVIRNFFSGGHFAVSVFYVISGYVLAAKPLQLIQSRQYEALNDNLGSALFRRYMRLYIPVICSTFFTLSLWHVFGVTANYKPQKTYWKEIVKWFVELKNFSFIFRSGGNPWFSYSFHVWSIPVEFRGSLVVYSALIALSRATKNARLWCEVALIYYFLYIADGAHFAMFLMGMFLCDLDLLALNGELPEWFSLFKPYKKYIFNTMFVLSMFLGGSPSHTSDIRVLRKTPGWRHLAFLKPQAVFDYKWFYLFWAATFLVASAPNLPWLKAFFETRFNQYLGRISFAFYLIHGPLLWSLGDRLYAATGFGRASHALALPGWLNRFPLPKSKPFGLELAFLVPQIILIPVNFWAGEILTTFVDDPTIKFTQWLYTTAIGLEPGETATNKKNDAVTDKKDDDASGVNGHASGRGRSSSISPAAT
ncbi:hypothetical protein DV738_g1602, partial [Chaetothyriales sp. CBS 135597]